MKYFLLWCFAIPAFTVVFGLSMAQANEYRVGIRLGHNMEKSNQYTSQYERLFVAIAKITSDQFLFVYLPPARVKKALNDGKIDIEPGTNPVWYKGSRFVSLYSVPYAYNSSIILFKKGYSFAVPTVKHLGGHTVGVVRGYRYPTLDPLFASGEVKRFDAIDEVALIEGVLSGRLQQVVVSKRLAKYWVKTKTKRRSFEFGDVIDKVDVMLRVHPDKEELMPRLNRAISGLVASGKIEKLFIDGQ